MLNQFKAYLLQKGNINSHHVPYYIKWVGDCYAFLDAPDSTFINSDQKKHFLVHMAKRHEEQFQGGPALSGIGETPLCLYPSSELFI